MSNGRDVLPPELEAKLAEISRIRREEYERDAPERERRTAELMAETRRSMAEREAAERPAFLERNSQMKIEDKTKDRNIANEWLEMNSNYIANDKTTMIPSGTNMAVLTSNRVNIVKAPRNLFFPIFHMGGEIIAVERRGGRKTKRTRRQRKTKRKRGKHN